uniref:Geranylgeranyl transferase type-2 subunit beta n=1 Tax=Tetraodon nigroviridis TaxID=99883 RepID=H3CLM1_TETNG
VFFLRQGTQVKDVILKPDCLKTLLLDKHADYIASYGSKNDDYEYTLSEYLRMSGIYWGLTAMDLMGQLPRMNRQEIIDFITACQHECGGISASIGHDPHLLYTLSAIQVTSYSFFPLMYCMRNMARLSQLNLVVTHSTCSVTVHHWIIKQAISHCEDRTQRMHKGFNFELGNVLTPAYMIWACFYGFSFLPSPFHHQLYLLWPQLKNLISHAKLTCGFQLPDLCYSWWVLASLKIIGKLHWIDKAKLRTFILACQDEETGGFADRPGDMVDPFHTLFGVAGLSLLGDEQIKPVNPVLCMPEDIVQRLNLKPELLS